MITITPLSIPWSSSYPGPSSFASSTFDPTAVPPTDSTKSSEERPKALAYLLDVDNLRILIGCGAPETLTFQRDELGLRSENKSDEEEGGNSQLMSASHAAEQSEEERSQGKEEPDHSDVPDRLRGETLARRARSENLDTLLAE